MKTKLARIGVPAVGAAALLALVVLRRPPELDAPEPRAKRSARPEPVLRQWRPLAPPKVTVEQPKPEFKPAPARELGRALQEASIRNLVQNLRVASEQGDESTMRALLTGLRRRGKAARAVVEAELVRTLPESPSYFALKEVLR